MYDFEGAWIAEEKNKMVRSRVLGDDTSQLASDGTTVNSGNHQMSPVFPHTLCLCALVNGSRFSTVNHTTVTPALVNRNGEESQVYSLQDGLQPLHFGG